MFFSLQNHNCVYIFLLSIIKLLCLKEVKAQLNCKVLALPENVKHRLEISPSLLLFCFWMSLFCGLRLAISLPEEHVQGSHGKR